ncbi:MAG: metallophosphoesterase [bacterium]
MKLIYGTYVILFMLCINLEADFLDKGTIILGRPTTNSITANVLAKDKIEFFVEYGLSSGNYTNKSENYTTSFPEQVELIINNLSANTRYFYRIQYRENESQSFSTSQEYFFQTQRAKGSSFSFTIQADPHLYDKKGSSGLMKVSMENQAKDSTDFILDLGDTFGDDHNPTTITDEQVKKLHLDYLPFFGMLCHSSPLFLCIGNHEGESGYYLLQTPPDNLAVYETKWRQKYYPNPFPDGFYSGNTDEEELGIGKPENYYAWEWADALFVVIDVYRYYTANAKPQKWDWTIGDKQYFWFKNNLETSKAKYKFVFAHHTLGQGRGAVSTAMLYEWGGWEDTKKTKWGFSKSRPGWDKPIHQLMVDNGVNIFFQGHDHLFAKEELDGVVYQEVPMPSDSTYEIGVLANADAYTDLTMDGAGYLKVTVSDPEVKVDYIKSYLPQDETDSLKNGMLSYSYTVKSRSNSIEEEITMRNIGLEQNQPNPFNHFTSIDYTIQEAGNVQLKVFDAMGNEVCTLVNEYQQYGNYSAKLDAEKLHLPSGIYFYMLQIYNNILTKSMILRK